MKADAYSPQGHPDDAPAHGSLRDYLIGFVLSVMLTAAAFWLVMAEAFPSKPTSPLVLMLLAVVQIVVHMIYFLHMNPRSENGWTFMALVFTLVLVGITISGSVWVMNHLNENMMLDSNMSQMP